MPLKKQEDSSVFDNFELRLNEQSKKFLRETARWAFILSIIGFIVIGLFVFVAVFFGVMFSAFNSNANPFQQQGLSGGFIGIVYFVLAILYFFPVMYLYRFSRRMKAALAEKSTDGLTRAFSSLKSHYKFLGIVILSIVGIYALVFVFAIIAGIAGI
ncbi:DUF5362 family protein [Kordia jejudonensis]|uniref:DUF5362 family protein n=1 Tax=Kordia jejudonensis TaxID=1348245 RepID=UPI00062945E4|nr:DUF5362 family protein [Kordia jejudonensis]